ncbi:Serine protease Do-like HtrA [Anatilimnocola aggregata]|uniref:Serine protease Do-like HtrA n=1 Tax=Anatilimnocola aggregata TaxID=2528021 RepID=A0A517Y7Q8_9BACT|nr:serine protease [Anatilimnocola aggregata]QDU26235.1 Serine protease Do-like HtrA [Anatilimnocola aggregata]
MSKKTSTKKPASKPAKAKAAKKAKAPTTKPAAPETKPTGTCPKGGNHEWTEEGAERFCTKCKEPEVTKGKRAKSAKNTKPATDKKMSALDAAARLLGETQELTMMGSGLVSKYDGGKIQIYTNSHVLCLMTVAEEAAQQRDRTANISKFAVEIQFPSGKRKTADRIAVSTDRDVACVEVNAEGLTEGIDFVVVPAVKNAMEVLDVQHGDDVIAVGTPLDLELANSLTFGRVSSFRTLQNDPTKVKWIQHDASIAGGNSGGPLFLARKGRAYWIGINTLGADGASLSMAISSDDVTNAPLRWSESSPSGAAALIEQVYGIAAVAGNQKMAYSPNKTPRPSAVTGRQPARVSSEPFVIKKPDSLATILWPFTSSYPYISFRGAIFWVFLLNGVRWFWTAPRYSPGG